MLEATSIVIGQECFDARPEVQASRDDCHDGVLQHRLVQVRHFLLRLENSGRQAHLPVTCCGHNQTLTRWGGVLR